MLKAHKINEILRFENKSFPCVLDESFSKVHCYHKVKTAVTKHISIRFKLQIF